MGQRGSEEQKAFARWHGDDAARRAVYNNRARLKSTVARQAFKLRVERDYRELKQEVGLGHFEGRSWRGLNHHVTLCLAAYGFLVRERSLFPLSTPDPNSPETSTPVRPARHSPWSIASLRRRIAGHLIRSLPKCPYCGTSQSHRSQTPINSPQLE